MGFDGKVRVTSGFLGLVTEKTHTHTHSHTHSHTNRIFSDGSVVL